MHIGRNGYLYVSESANNRVQIFEGRTSIDKHEDTPTEGVKMLSSRRPVYTIGPTSDEPVGTLSGTMEPWGVTVATPSGDIFVVSKKSKKVMICSSQNYELKEEINQLVWESNSRDSNDMTGLAGITICEDGCLLLTLQNQVVKITLLGQVVASIGKRGHRGRVDTELNTPNGIAVWRDRRVYVADKGNYRVQIFNADLSYRNTCYFPDRPGLRTDIYPESVAVNSGGNVYVTDCRNDCVYVFNSDGRFLFRFGKKGSICSKDRGNLSSPVAISIDHEDYVYVSGSKVGVSIFDREGCFVRAFGACGREPEDFRDIKAMHIDHKGNLYVCESKDNRVRIFAGIKSRDQVEKDRAAILSQEANSDVALPVTVLSNNIREPHGVTEGRNGEIVVVSQANHKVLVFDRDCKLTTQFGAKGDLDGSFNNLTSVAITSENFILVSSHDKLQWFTMEGQLVYVTGNSGKGELEFDHPDSIAIGRDGKIYVLEKRNKRVQILKGDATFHSSFSLKVDHPPEALAVNSEGKIFFADVRDNCVQVFSPEGKYLSMFYNMGPKELTVPAAVAIDDKDNIYVGTISGIVVVFDKAGCFICTFRVSSDIGQFSIIRGLHVGQSGYVYVSECLNNQVQVFRLSSTPYSENSSPSLPPVTTVSLPHRPVFTVGPISSLPVKVLSGVRQPCGIVTGQNGDVFVASHQDNAILIYSSADSQPRWQIAEIKNARDHRNKRINCPYGLAFTQDGYLLVSVQHQMLKMSLDGTVWTFVGNEKNIRGSGERDLSDPRGIAVRKDGLIYLVDQGNHRIQTFQSNFAYLATFSNPNVTERTSECLESVAFNSAGDLFVTDSHNCRVQVYNHNGKFAFAFGKKDDPRRYKRGGLSRPHAIAIDHEDFVYVGGDDGIVSIFNRRGDFVRTFGGPGDKPGQFRDIRGMHIDKYGQLYVCEWITNRIQVFRGQP